MKEKYIPSLEEVKKSEEMMSQEEKKMSEEREATFEKGYKEGVKKAYSEIASSITSKLDNITNREKLDELYKLPSLAGSQESEKLEIEEKARVLKEEIKKMKIEGGMYDGDIIEITLSTGGVVRGMFFEVDINSGVIRLNEREGSGDMIPIRLVEKVRSLEDKNKK
ncbi:MAG: hypothetical protein Q8N28_00240 [bacterium]|nr:hypothetical protein [bacterium]